MRKVIKFLISAYLRLVNLFRKIEYPVLHKDRFRLGREDFEDLINTYEYKADPLGGAVDMVGNPDRFFDSTIKYNRDCDNWARIWSLWGTYNGYQAREWVICNPKSIIKAFQTMHVITTLKSNSSGKWFLANYHWYGPFNSEEEALDFMRMFQSYSTDRLAVFSREIPPEKE